MCTWVTANGVTLKPRQMAEGEGREGLGGAAMLTTSHSSCRLEMDSRLVNVGSGR